MILVLGLVACKPTVTQPKHDTCQSTADCKGGLVCTFGDGGDGQCLPCELDNQCQRDEICQPIDRRCELRHCFGRDCKLNADCSLGQFCVQGLCLDPRTPNDQGCTVTTCVSPADCTAPMTRCDVKNNVCIDDIGCTEDDECGDGERCNVANGQCRSACTADTAAEICGIRQQCSPGGLCVDCLANADCGIGLTCDVSKFVCVGSNSCRRNADCKIPLICHPLTHQCTTKPPICSSDTDCTESQFCYTTEGFCVERVCQPDSFEPNNSFDTAKPLPIGATNNLTLCAHEADYFSMALVNGDHLDIVVDTPTGGALFPFEISLLDESGAAIADSHNFALDAIISVSGTYRIKTQSTDDYVQYGLRASITRGIPCQAGPGSPTTTYLQADPLDTSGLSGVSLCPGDKDWFVASVPRGQRLTATLNSDVSLGALDLYLYDSDGMTLLDSDTDIAGTKSVSSNAFSGTAPKAYIKVSADPSTQNVYDLTLTLAP